MWWDQSFDEQMQLWFMRVLWWRRWADVGQIIAAAVVLLTLISPRTRGRIELSVRQRHDAHKASALEIRRVRRRGNIRFVVGAVALCLTVGFLTAGGIAAAQLLQGSIEFSWAMVWTAVKLALAVSLLAFVGLLPLLALVGIVIIACRSAIDMYRDGVWLATWLFRREGYKTRVQLLAFAIFAVAAGFKLILS
jgi:hypothetical protein